MGKPIVLLMNLHLLKFAKGELGVICDGRIYFFKYTDAFPACSTHCDVYDNSRCGEMCNICTRLLRVRMAVGHDSGDYYAHRVLAADTDKLIDMDKNQIIF